MKILVIGGTRFFGVPMIKKLIDDGHDITIATRGKTADVFGTRIKRITFDLFHYNSCEVLNSKQYDVVIDKISYSSNEIKAILNNVNCNRFIHMSTANVYNLNHYNIAETEYDPTLGEIFWCDRFDAPYEVNKRNSERVLFQCGFVQNYVSVRYPVVFGKNDYTERLKFYVDHIIDGKPMYINDLNEQLCFIEEREAGDFISYLVGAGYTGAINGSSKGTISVKEILDYIENAVGTKAVINSKGEEAPLNGMVSNSLSTDIAKQIGYEFTEVREWMYPLLDYYITKGL